MVRLINDLIGTGDYGERFGDIALSHPFMGRLTLSLTTLGHEDGYLVAGINIRSPAGRSREDLEAKARDVVDAWKEMSGVADVSVNLITSDPYYLEDAPHIPMLLDIFSFYADQPDPQPISIGGRTHARLTPNRLNFGPPIPPEPYTRHPEHEYITREQLLLNLEMYTAMLVELAAR
jgi:dipeptidase D